MQEMIPISKFKATCLRLLDNVKKTGNSIIITRKGEPIALVSPPPPQLRPDQWLGSMKDNIKITGNIISPALDEHESKRRLSIMKWHNPKQACSTPTSRSCRSISDRYCHCV
jgi:prevent-host-death family protein